MDDKLLTDADDDENIHSQMKNYSTHLECVISEKKKLSTIFFHHQSNNVKQNKKKGQFHIENDKCTT